MNTFSGPKKASRGVHAKSIFAYTSKRTTEKWTPLFGTGWEVVCMTKKIYIPAPVTDPAVIDFIRVEVQKYPKPENFYNFALALRDFGDKSNDKEMFENLAKASESGLADATNLLGDCYFYGIGVEQDQKKGVELFVKAADMGSIHGCFSAGNELLLGKVVDADYPAAYGYLKKAAKEGDDRAFNSLGIMYLFGYHVRKSRRKAMSFFKKSASMGNEQAASNLRKLEASEIGADLHEVPILKPSEIPKDGEKK